MTLSNLRAHAAFLTILLVFCYFVGLSATADTNSLPESVVELLSGKTTDFTGVANQIPEHQLPTALAAVKALKFRALHGETSLSNNEAETFETILLDRMSTARQVAFSQNETCRKKVEQHEIMFDGQKLLVPTHFVADTALAIIDCRPKGEAGSLFPDFNIEVFSQSPLTEVTLAINGNAINARNILVKQSENAFELSYRIPATSDSLLAIGTHTAEISIINKDGEKSKKEWLFTVGIESFNPGPIPEDAQPISEFVVPVTRLVDGEGPYQNVRVIVYEDGNGNRHEKYVIDTANGSIEVRNLKHLRNILTARRDAAELQVFPRSGYAFPGNPLHFSYTYSGEGSVVESRYSLNGPFGSWFPGATYDTILATKPVEVYFEAKVAKPDPEHENETITVSYKAGHRIKPLIPEFSFENPHNYIFTREAKATLPFKRSLKLSSPLYKIDKFVIDKLEEGDIIEISEPSGKGSLQVKEFRAEIVVSSGSVELKNKVASQTEILFATPGYIEITQYSKLTYSYGEDESYSQNFKDEKSSLNALFNVQASAEFLKYPQKGLISATDILIPLKLLSLQINDEKRVFKSIEDIGQPWVLLKSEHYPKMEPIALGHLDFDIKDPAAKTHFIFVDFGYRVYVATTDEILALKPEFVPSLNYTELKFDSLPEFSIFPRESKLIEVSVDPSGPQKLYEGDTRPFKAAIIPVEGMGSGVFDEKGNSLEILDFYKPVEIDYFQWLELPLMDEKAKRSFKETEFKHIFDPWWGIGEYELTVDALVDFETEYGSTFYLQGSNKVEVEVLPGLVILSPISDVAYPLGAALKVTSSVDDDPEKWKNISWSLNGKHFKPSTQEAPFYITPDHAGKWTLVASLTIEADDRRKPVDLASEVKFFVQPINYELSPAKQVYPLADASDIALDLIIKINGNQIEKPGDLVPWQEDFLLATVDKVDWLLVQKEQGCASFNAESDKFKTQVDFNRRGAATALATITVRLIGAEKAFYRHNPQFKNRYEEPVFELPATRADLWAVVAGPMQNITGRFPQTAIAAAYRTYELASFTFELACIDKKEYAFNKDTGLQKVVLDPALPDIEFAIETSNISFKWKAESSISSIQQEQELPTRFVIKPAEPCTYTVNLEAFLHFAGSGQINIGETKTPAEAVSLFSLIETSVEPSSFTMTLGETRTLKYLVRSLETPPPPPAVTTSQAGSADKLFLYLMNENFILTIDKVEWSYDYTASDPQVPAKESVIGSSYDFHPLTPGYVNGNTKCYLKITETFSTATANSTIDVVWKSFIKALSVQVLINGDPIESQKFHLGQKITLSYIAKSGSETVIFPEVKWHLSNPLIKNSETSTFPHASHTVNFLTEDELENQSLTFYLFDYAPNIIMKSGFLEYSIGDYKASASFSISYDRPYINNVIPEQNDQIQIISSGSTYIGFPVVGARAKGDYHNPTDIHYAVGFFQLILRDNTRSFVANDDTIFLIEKLKTIASTSSLISIPDFWLDTNAPLCGAHTDSQFILEPHSHELSKIVADDAPLFMLLENQILPGNVQVYAKDYEGTTKFYVVIFAKPQYMEYFEGAWFPIKILEWGWFAKTKYNSSLGSWEDNAQNYNFDRLKDKDVFMPEWPDRAISEGNYPDWRKLFK
ncbi:MAG: hypothetical protein CVV64_18885 [Candidatus Wallbacteria bacterium HGW-Wallbacteria-1]|jgi:hypothetical protein|uniref:Uncharacterized protein n=1 Tax=Candidatus Wallbacteria bacterium HGW-Wallbacteria-1 TaxID=2013854 RepID=A0A2N1PJB9_9BACT|nr:MAG: hypothetical protein CVV64_18885 [Candidatus Wallbacteria bacterium HGW-Wallbacteria-1]